MKVLPLPANGLRVCRLCGPHGDLGNGLPHFFVQGYGQIVALAPAVAETAVPQATRCVTIRVMYVNWYASREKASGLETEMVDVTAKDVSGVMVVKVEGSLGIDTLRSAEVDGQLMEVIDDQSKNVIINLEDVPYISSTGLRVFLVIGKKLKSSGGELHFCCRTEFVQECFDISGFSGLFKTYKTEDEAVQRVLACRVELPE